MTRDQFISLCFIALLIFVVYQVFVVFSPFFRALFWAAILAFGFYPIYKDWRRSFKKRETVAAATLTALIFLLVIPPVIWIFMNLAEQAVQLYGMATSYIREGRLEQFIERIRSMTVVQGIETHVNQWDILKRDAAVWILNSTNAIWSFTTAQTGAITQNILFVILNVLLAFVLLFIFLRDGERIYSFIYDIAPLEERSKRSIFSEINETFAAVIRGQLLTAFAQSSVAALVFWGLGLPVPLLFGALTFLSSMIPVLGASFIWLPLVLYLVLLESYTKAIILFIAGALGISLIDNLLKPALIGEKTKLPYFLLFFGILGGIKVYGLMGIFLAPVILSLFFAVVKIYREKFL